MSTSKQFAAALASSGSHEGEEQRLLDGALQLRVFVGRELSGTGTGNLEPQIEAQFAHKLAAERVRAAVEQPPARLARLVG